MIHFVSGGRFILVTDSTWREVWAVKGRSRRAFALNGNGSSVGVVQVHHYNISP